MYWMPMPLGANAAARNNSVIFVNARMGKIFEINSQSLLDFHLNNLMDDPLGPIGDQPA